MAKELVLAPWIRPRCMLSCTEVYIVCPTLRGAAMSRTLQEGASASPKMRRRC